MPVSSVLCHLSSHLVSGHIVFHQVSPSQLWSASISLSFYLHLQYLSRVVIFISPLYMWPNHLNLFSLRNSAIGYVCASFQMSTFLTWSSLVFPLAHRSMRISVVCNFLSFVLTAQHSAPYTMAGFIAVLYTLSFNFVGMFLSHCFHYLSSQILVVVCGDLWWFVVVCGGLWSFVL